jgi:hypothetical protein
MWREVLNSDAAAYGGSGVGNSGGFEAEPVPWHGRPFSLNLSIPPLGICMFKNENLPPAGIVSLFPRNGEAELKGKENGGQ